LPLLAERGLAIAMNRLHARPDDGNNGNNKNGD
jgi:hypothetical protein